MRHFRRTWLLKLLSLITCLFAGIYFLDLSNRPFNNTKQSLAAERDFNAYKMALLAASPAKNFAQLSTTARRNLIIVSHGRSGSTLMGDIFNHHPSVFYMYEPLQTAERVVKRGELTNASYGDLVDRFLTGIFRCKFDQPQTLDDIERYYRKPAHPRISQAIASPPLCPYRLTDPRWDPKLCYPMTSESLGNACKDYDMTVIKVLMSRIPENSIKTILTSCNPLDVDCKIAFLVRDPRAVIPSSRMIGFYKEKDETNAKQSTRLFSYWQCKQTEDNLEFIRKLPGSLRDRIKLQRYEDLAINPLKELSGLYDFARLPVLESVRTWLNETTQLSRKDCDRQMDGVSVTCTKDDAWAAANRWRWKVHPFEIDIIEYYCGRVMRLMGYRPVDRSYQLLTNVKIPLFSDEYEAKHWFLH